MSNKYKFHNPDGIYFVTFSVVDWIDVFTRTIYCELLIKSIKYCQEHKGLVVHAYIIMSNHVHMIISRSGINKLEDIMRDLKKYTAFQILNEIIHSRIESRKEWMLAIFKRHGSRNSNNTKYQFWQQDNHPIELYSNKMMDQKLDYIHNNPVKAQLVDDPSSWIFSSARSYEGKQGLLELVFIE